MNGPLDLTDPYSSSQYCHILGTTLIKNKPLPPRVMLMLTATYHRYHRSENVLCTARLLCVLETDLDMSYTEVSSPCCMKLVTWRLCCSHIEATALYWRRAFPSCAHTLLLNPYWLWLVLLCLSCDHTLVTCPCCLVLVLIQVLVPFVQCW